MNKKFVLFIIGSLCFATFLFGASTSTVLNAQNEKSAISSSFIPSTFSFQNDLKLGDNNQDVRQLQIFLNNDVATHVSSFGIGSKGQESTYFGPLTADAVMRFQLKYKIDASGVVDVSTRTKLNQLISTIVSIPTSTPDISSSSLLVGTSTISNFSGPLPLAKERLPRLYTVQPQRIKKGDTFVLVGAGFQTDNTIHIGSNVFNHVLPLDNNNISFKIPASSNIQNGTYEVWVENSQGVSKVSGQPINLIITDNTQSTPTISSVFPITVSGSESVTVTGTNFTPTDNGIVSGFGAINNFSSSGMTITFSPRSLLTPQAISQIPVGRSIRIDFYIVNSNGASNTYGSVNLTL